MSSDENKNKYLEKPWLAFYPKDVPASIEIPDRSIPQIFDEGVSKWGDKTAIIFYGRKMSYRELSDQVNRFANALHDLGIGKGDMVGLYLLNSPQFIIAYYGALKAGAIMAPISPIYVSSEIRHQLRDSETKTVICQDILYEHLKSADIELKNVIFTNIGEYLPPVKKFFGKSILRSVYKGMKADIRSFLKQDGYFQFSDLIRKYSPDPPQVEFVPKDDLVALLYTGGTTGQPKGAMITHHNVVANEIQAGLFQNYFEPGNESLVVYQPLYHAYGQVLMNQSILRGYQIILLTTPDMDQILNYIRSYKASVFWSVPSVFEHLKEYDKTDRVDWKRLKAIISGADALLESTAKGWEKRTGTKIIEGYGMTETTAPTHTTPRERPKAGSFGIPIVNTRAAVIEADSTDFVAVGEVGELIVNGPQVMKGYWKQPEQTADSFIEIDGEKWLKTSDLVRMDEEGYFYFFDRKRDLIKYKAYSVYAREIEECISTHPMVDKVGVIGVRDPKVGENIKAIVVPKTESRGRITEQDIFTYCEEKLAHYKVPKIVEFRGEIPLTDIGKVSRRELREELEDI
ncbi:AMP-binding protein [Thermodesulfobacteriota bacterium]